MGTHLWEMLMSHFVESQIERGGETLSNSLPFRLHTKFRSRTAMESQQNGWESVLIIGIYVVRIRKPEKKCASFFCPFDSVTSGTETVVHVG